MDDMEIGDLIEARSEDGTAMRVVITGKSGGKIWARSVSFKPSGGEWERRDGRPGEWDLSVMRWEKIASDWG